MKDNLKWYVVDKEYVSYLKEFDNKVENIDYRFKHRTICTPMAV